jgi:hypothetical protein
LEQVALAIGLLLVEQLLQLVRTETIPLLELLLLLAVVSAVLIASDYGHLAVRVVVVLQHQTVHFLVLQGKVMLVVLALTLAHILVAVVVEQVELVLLVQIRVVVEAVTVVLVFPHLLTALQHSVLAVAVAV